MPGISRLLPWEGTLNTRELGGYPVANGGQTRWKVLIRSETTSALTPGGQQALLDYGIRTIIDLRFRSEIDMNPSPFVTGEIALNGQKPDYFHIPLDEDQDLSWPSRLRPAEIMSELYIRLLEANTNHVSKVLTRIAKARPGGVLFHCHAGKDRTGLIAAILLGVLGVPDDLIIADYAFTSQAQEERRRHIYEDPSLTPDQRKYYSILTNNLAETMLLTLDLLKERYGGVLGYLRTTPVSSAVLDLLRQRFVEMPT